MTGSEMRVTLRKAEISVLEAAQLFQVSRFTVYRWCRDKAVKPKNLFIYTRACEITHKIEKAVASHRLPLTDPKILKRQRLGFIELALKNRKR